MLLGAQLSCDGSEEADAARRACLRMSARGYTPPFEAFAEHGRFPGASRPSRPISGLVFQLHAGGRAPGHRLSPSKRAIIATGLPHEIRCVRMAASCGSIARRPCRDGRRHARCARRGAQGQGAGRSAPRRRLQHLLPPRPDRLGPARPRRGCGRLDQLRPGEDAAAVVGGPCYRAAHRGRHPRARGAGGEGAVQRVLPGMGDRAPPGPGAGDENTGHYEHAHRCPRRRARRRDPPCPTYPRAAGSRRRQRRHRRARQSYACCDRRRCQRSRQRRLCPPRRQRAWLRAGGPAGARRLDAARGA